MADKSKEKQLIGENEQFRARLEELEETIRAIQSGEVDALVVSGEQGEQVFTLRGACQPYRVLMETMNEGAITLASDGIVLYSNLRFATMLGMPLDRIIGSSIRLHVVKDELPAFDLLLGKCLNAACQAEFRLISGDKTVPVQLSFSPVSNDGMHCAVVVVTDLTDQKRIEGALRRASVDLELQVQERTAQLQKSEEHLRLAQAAGGIGTFDWDITNGEACCSPEYYRIMGIVPREDWKVTFAEWQFRIHPEDRERLNAGMKNALAHAEEELSDDYRIFSEKGRIRWISYKAKVTRDAAGSPIRMLGIVMDITERKRAEEALRESETLLRTVLDGSPDAIFLKDRESRLLLANPAAFAVIGKPAEACLGKTDEQFYDNPADGRAIRANDRRIMASGQTETFEETVSTPFGPRYYLSTKAPYRDASGNIIGLIGVAREITERKQAERELNNLMEELKRSNADLEEFASAASHDLQEPLRVVSGFVKLLEKRYKDKLDEKAHEYIEYAVDGVKRMQLLIKDLLEYSRVGTKGKTFQPINCSVVLEKAIFNLHTALEESGMKLTYDLLPEVMADSSQVSRLFQNLIGNAIKFRGEDPKIHISAEQKGHEWVFSVKDNGIGLDPKFAKRIFVVFQRLHTSQEYKGTGIGLAICKKIVERHGGHIWVESEPGNGATFYFTLPVNGPDR